MSFPATTHQERFQRSVDAAATAIQSVQREHASCHDYDTAHVDLESGLGVTHLSGHIMVGQTYSFRTPGWNWSIVTPTLRIRSQTILESIPGSLRSFDSADDALASALWHATHYLCSVRTTLEHSYWRTGDAAPRNGYNSACA